MKKNLYIYRVILFALWTGCKRKDIAILQWQNVTKDSARIIGKGDKERTISLLPKAIGAMGKKKDVFFVFTHYNDLSKYSKAF